MTTHLEQLAAGATADRGGQLLRRSPGGPPSTATDSTGSPRPSARSIDTELGPVGAIRTRTADAPAACSDTFCQENGSASSSSSARQHHRVQRARRAAPGARRTRRPAASCGHGDLGEHLVAAPPHRGQALERRAVLVAARGQLRVGVGDVDRGAPAGGHTDRSAPGLRRSRRRARPRRAASTPRPSVAGAREHRHRTRTPDSSAAPTTTCTGTPVGGSTSGACSISSSTTAQPTSSPARMASSTKPAPGNSTTPPTA